MAERKVLNKYFPPDFDPLKIPRRKSSKNQQMKVRMMLPMSIRCKPCGNYIGKGTKFNSRKEDCMGEKYLGIQLFRFYFKCTTCSAEITMKTDPQKNDYTIEFGATRNYEPWRVEDEVMGKAKRKRDEDEIGDPIKALENRTNDSKLEMDIEANLYELKSKNARRERLSDDAKFKALQRDSREQEELEEQDEAMIKSIVFLQGSAGYVRRIDDDDFNEEVDKNVVKKRKESREETSQATTSLSKTSPFDSLRTNMVRISVVKKRVGSALETRCRDVESFGLQSLCQNYDIDNED